MCIRIGIDLGSHSVKTVILEKNGEKYLPEVKTAGKAFKALSEVLSSLKYDRVKLCLTGQNAAQISALLGADSITETQAIPPAAEKLIPDAQFILQMGAQSQTYYSLSKDASSGKIRIDDAVPGGKCAGGTGSFIDYMYKRLSYESLDDFAQKAIDSPATAGISARCAVFAESDIVHHYQKGTAKDAIAAGIHQAAAKNYRALIQKSKKPSGSTYFIGGAASNKCLLASIEKELGIPVKQAPHNTHFIALGAALKAEKTVNLDEVRALLTQQTDKPFHYEHSKPLKLDKSVFLEMPEKTENGSVIETAGLGIDIGSVSTKAALVIKKNGGYEILASHYRRTEGDPLKAVKLTLEEIEAQIKDYAIENILVCTTGSGRYLTAAFTGANKIVDEITAQAGGTAAFTDGGHISIIELGGQDSKYIEIKDGQITDFEMNWACAAGTGALIEKHAKNLDIEIQDFGDIALRGQQPPIINSNCAVFAESALKYFQQNNLSKENLCSGACIASASNYLTKVLRNRNLCDNIVFQGAVAFNKGMVAAFETLLDRSITVLPFPHLTGAAGAAVMVLQQPQPSKFRGFAEIRDSKHELTSFGCKLCDNECQVNVFSLEGEKFYQGDRCDRYSGQNNQQQQRRHENLFKKREEMLLASTIEGKNTRGKKVGIPRGLFFTDFYPLFSTYFSQLGFEVTASPPTNKKIIAMGINAVVAEPCLPVKVAHGHTEYLCRQKVDYIFMPYIFSGAEKMKGYEMSAICPYVQSAPDVITSAVGRDGTEFITPNIFFDRGEKHLKRIFREVAQQLSVSRGDSDKALATALKAQKEFREKIRKLGEETLANLKEKAFVIVGRPYGIYDEALNMNVAEKITGEGYLAIPFDFLPLEKYGTAETWTNMYSFQGQKKLAAARYIAGNENLHALIITYFGCGPDAFIDQMFKEELGRHYLTVQIDEHTSDTGVITRIQAYLNSAKETIPEKREIKPRRESFVINVKDKKTLWLPDMSPAAHVLASVMRSYGIDARVLPRSQDRSLSMVRKLVTGDVCLPMLYTTQDMLERAAAEDFDPEREAFFQGKSGGPCRYGMYFMLEKLVIGTLHPDHEIEVSMIGNKNINGGLGNLFLITCWDVLVCHDMIEKMMLRVRPYEKEKGGADRIFNESITELQDIIETGKYSISSFKEQAAMISGKQLEPLKKLIVKARGRFDAILDRTIAPKPLIGLIGEFYVRQHEPSNGYIIRKLEEMGAEIWTAPITEFLSYSNYISSVHCEELWRDDNNPLHLADMQLRKQLTKLAERNEHILYRETLPLMEGYDEITSEEMVNNGHTYVNKLFGGEAIVSLGKAVDFAKRDIYGIINAGPFNCMPNIIVSALCRDLRNDHDGIPFLNLDYDGYEDSTREEKISIFFSQVMERFRMAEETKKEPVKV